MDTEFTYMKLAIIGSATGVVASVVGGGAEILIVPLLIHMNIVPDYKTAIGTSLASLLLPIGIVAVYFYARKNCGGRSCVRWTYALIISLFFLIGTGASYWTSNLNTQYLKLLFGLLAIALGILIVYEEYPLILVNQIS